MTYHSPGLRRSSFLSATAGSSSSASPSTSAGASSAASAGLRRTSAGAASASSLTGVDVGVVGGGLVGSSLVDVRLVDARLDHVDRFTRGRIAIEGSHGLSVLSNSIRSAENQHHKPGHAQVDQSDQRHHERQEDQHHRGVGDHLLAVRPDDLAQLGDDLAQVVDDERDGVSTGLSAPFLAFFFFALASSSRRVGFLRRATPRRSSSAAAPRRDRLPVGRTGCVDTEPAPSRSSVTACLPSGCGSPSSVHACRVFS